MERCALGINLKGKSSEDKYVPTNRAGKKIILLKMTNAKFGDSKRSSYKKINAVKCIPSVFAPRSPEAGNV